MGRGGGRWVGEEGDGERREMGRGGGRWVGEGGGT